ncbi:MAG: hypothetical protein HZA93_16210 [Verrucomicrobia bacterium]|nr:hypothetical protein [Verrucomicrobiota bacterium]
MKTQFFAPFVRAWSLVVVAVVGGSLLHASDPSGTIVYTPGTPTIVEGNIPFPTTITIKIKAPDNLAGPVTVTPYVTIDANTLPAGVSLAKALSFVSFSPSQLTFTTPLQELSTQFTVTFTLEALPTGSTVGSALYVYRILTSGWGVPVDDPGTFINASATAAASTGSGPLTTAVVAPADGSTVQLNSGETSRLINFSFTATASPGDPLTNVTATVDGLALPLTFQNSAGSVITGPTGQLAVTASGSMTLAPGQHEVIVNAYNAAGNGTGQATDTNGFRINSVAVPPVATVSLTNGASYTLRAGDGTLNVPFTFAVSRPVVAGDVNPLVVLLDGAPTSYTLTSAVNALSVTGGGTRTFSEAELPAGISTHTLTVQGTDANGTSNLAAATFTINYIRPTPTITITSPTTAAITIPTGATTVNVPFTILSASSTGFGVDSVVAWLDTGATFSPSTTGLGTISATSTGTLAAVGAGVHTLQARVSTGGNAAITATTSVTFEVKSSTTLPPTVVINTPPAGSVFTRVSGGPALSIPLTFTGSSLTPGGTITTLTAKLDGANLALTTTGIGTAVANGSATMSVSTAGAHTITVSAVDAYGTATATRTFQVNVVTGRTICGDTFFDVDFDGQEDSGEFGLSGVLVRLLNSSGQVVATATSNACGNYSFGNVGPGTYVVAAIIPTGLKATTLNERSVTVAGADVRVPLFGFGLDFNALRTMTANGNSQGYWKTNIDKAIAGSTSGVQVSKSTLSSYTTKIGDFALSPYDNITLKTASSTLGYSGSSVTSLLSKQLIASEYNYQAGAYLNGNKTLTMLFVWWGEYVLANPGRYSSTYITWAKNWFEAYNVSHGGVVAGPAP